jgi:hypothetical protein
MKLLTQAIKKALPLLYATDKIPLEEKIVICKFFMPGVDWTWYVFEGEPESNGDFTFFGMVFGHVAELGYFNLFELLKGRSPLGLPIERDTTVFKRPYREQVLRDGLDSHFNRSA